MNRELYTLERLIRSSGRDHAVKKCVQSMQMKYRAIEHELNLVVHAVSCGRRESACAMVRALEDRRAVGRALFLNRLQRGRDIGALQDVPDLFKQMLCEALKPLVARKLF